MMLNFILPRQTNYLFLKFPSLIIIDPCNTPYLSIMLLIINFNTSLSLSQHTKLVLHIFGSSQLQQAHIHNLQFRLTPPPQLYQFLRLKRAKVKCHQVVDVRDIFSHMPDNMSPLCAKNTPSIVSTFFLNRRACVTHFPHRSALHEI